jgi:hypothetical protein
MKKEELDGFAIALTRYGPIMYCFNTNLTNLEEILKLEKIAQIRSIKRHEHLFKLYKIDDFGYVVISFN